MDRVKKWIQAIMRGFAKFLLKKQVGDKPFCVFSNDCWGGELYKWTERPFNTPFIGLMLMAPCYIKFLRNPQHYLSMPLVFVNESTYKEMNQFRSSHHMYPLGKLDDIEIHFLHYKTADEAAEKWERRKVRIDWNHLVVKFALDKDYAKPSDLDILAQMPYPKKISFSKEATNRPNLNVAMNDYDMDGARMFRLSLWRFSLGQFLKNGSVSPISGFDLLFGLVQKKFLK